MALNICIHSSPTKGKHGHLSGLHMFALAIELVGNNES